MRDHDLYLHIRRRWCHCFGDVGVDVGVDRGAEGDGAGAKRQSMSNTSIIFIFTSLFDLLESSNVLISHKHIKGMNKETLLRQKLAFHKRFRNIMK